ncbi:beta-lactamase superfamily protein [Ceratobasidium sp. AG-Ba]|nr:beta-lactamase superfamily protein [Ceratobasidium sp. AG-Ba]
MTSLCIPQSSTMVQNTGPVVKHLNADTSWLITFPVSTRDTTDGKFNVLIDPWLTGPQTDYYSWFSSQNHVIKSCVDHIADLGTRIDAIVLSHEWSDHTHRATLLEVDKDTPVYATIKAAELVRSWNHFSMIHVIKDLEPNTHWSTSRLPGLPSCLGISRISSTSFEIVSYYHVAICMAYVSPDTTDQGVIKTTANGFYIVRMEYMHLRWKGYHSQALK